MGNAVDVFKDITEDGNQWTPDFLAVPTRAELLESLQATAEPFDQAKPTGLEFMVADATPTSAKFSKPGLANMQDWLQKCKARVETKHGERQRWLPDFRQPEQMVVKGDGKVERSSVFGSRPRSGTCLVPVDRVKALKKGTGELLLTEERLLDLHDHLPVVTRLSNRWKLIYCPAVHGVSLQAFYRQCQNWPGETLLLASDHNGVVFGGFASHTWRPSHQDYHFGTPECFVFSYGPPEEGKPPAVHRWAGGEHHFMFADSTGFGMGGGNGYAFWIGEDLLKCSSVPSQTFHTTEPLASQRDVVLTTFECWSFDRGDAVPAALPAALPDQADGDHSGDAASQGSSPRSPEPARGRRSALREEALRWEAIV